MHTLGQRYKKEVKKKHVFTFFHFDKCEKVRFGICNYQKRTFSKSLRVSLISSQPYRSGS